MNSGSGSAPGVVQAEIVQEAAAPGSPVVVIHYRNRGVPTWILIPLVLIVPTTAILIYHRIVVPRYRAAAIEEFRAFSSPDEKSLAAPALTTESRPPEPLALNSQPILAGTPEPSIPKATAAEVAVTTSAASPRKQAGVTAAPPVVPAPENTSPVVEPRRSASALIDLGEASASRQTKGQPGPDAVAVAGAGVVAHGPGPQNPPIKPASTFAAEPAVDPEIATANIPLAAASTERLPSREESNREIEEESRRKQVEIEGLEEKKLTALRDMSHKERLTFRAELLDTLQLHGNRAGIEIDKLAKRYAYDTTSDRFLKAQYTWRASRVSTAIKVRYARSLDLPEVAILNFLSDLIHPRIGTRDGPRDRNEVRIKAARALLRYELPATEAIPPSPPGQPAQGNRGVDAARSPAASSSSTGVARRAR